ncbi:probable inactive DNA (cytosine-5)-methyltransferase DRM3 isoform X1 [Tanacetum coccineum]
MLLLLNQLAYKDRNSYFGSSRTAPKPPMSSMVSSQRDQRKYKERPKCTKQSAENLEPNPTPSCSSGTAMDPKLLSLSRKEGYIHNLPTENRFHVLPKPPMTIEEAIPETKKYWPSWDTRKQLSCISSETLGISQLCGSLRDILKSSKGILSPEQQKDILHQCKSLSLMWVGHRRAKPWEKRLHFLNTLFPDATLWDITCRFKVFVSQMETYLSFLSTVGLEGEISPDIRCMGQTINRKLHVSMNLLNKAKYINDSGGTEPRIRTGESWIIFI